MDWRQVILLYLHLIWRSWFLYQAEKSLFLHFLGLFSFFFFLLERKGIYWPISLILVHLYVTPAYDRQKININIIYFHIFEASHVHNVLDVALCSSGSSCGRAMEDRPPLPPYRRS